MAEIPQIIPTPQEIVATGGLAALGEEVDLAHLPAHLRGTAQEILARAGVRSVNGATCRVDLELLDRTAEDVPASARSEYYELEVGENQVLLRAVEQQGILWALHSLADLCRVALGGGEIPNLRLRDWPDLGHRGLFIEDKWGPDRMELADWKLLVDRLGKLKMNHLGIGLYGCWGSCRYEGQPTEFLMVPVPGHAHLRSEKRLRWYAPAEAQWHSETYLPFLFEGDFLGEVVAYGRERGVTVIPFVNSLGHNTLIPRLLPEVSAKDEEGRPLGLGYCLSAPETRTFIASFYGSVIERYFPDGADFFHVQLDEVWPEFPDPDHPGRRVDPWCRCAQCRRQPREESLQDYIVWLVQLLTARGVDRVVAWNDQLTRHMDALDARFVDKLREAGVADRLVLHWWWYSNEALNERTRVALGREFGLEGWVAPMTCYFNWSRYSPRLANIERMLEMAHDEGGEGALAYSVHDPGWADHEMLLADLAWNGRADGVSSRLETWAKSRFGADAATLLEASAALRGVAEGAALTHCYHYTYTYVREGMDFPRPYPGEALDALGRMEDAVDQLRQVAAQARKAGHCLAALVDGGAHAGDELACLRSLRGEAARLEGLADAFVALCQVRRAGADLSAAQRAHCRAARATLLIAMEIIERDKPRWVVPAILQSLSVLLEFLDQLDADLEAVLEGRLKWTAIRWTGGGKGGKS